MCTIIALNTVPPSKIGAMATYVSLTQTVAVVLGPVLSGAITHNQNTNSWRWIFLMNSPICGVALIALVVAWPSSHRKAGQTSKLSWGTISSLDFLGAGLLLATSVLLIFALQQAGAHVYAWNSGAVIASLVISGCSFTAFVFWERLVEWKSRWSVKPIFPIHLVAQRVMASAIVWVFRISAKTTIITKLMCP